VSHDLRMPIVTHKNSRGDRPVALTLTLRKQKLIESSTTLILAGRNHSFHIDKGGKEWKTCAF